jgi:hypothetical protein
MQMVKPDQAYMLCLYQWSGIMKVLLTLTEYRYSIHQKQVHVGPQGDSIDIGVIEHWINEADGLRGDQDALNEYYRQFPRTEEHAFRDETQNSIFNLAKIYEQIDYNEDLKASNVVTRGSFQWQNGVKDTKVIFSPNPQGRFMVTWTPSGAHAK